MLLDFKKPEMAFSGESTLGPNITELTSLLWTAIL